MTERNKLGNREIIQLVDAKWDNPDSVDPVQAAKAALAELVSQAPPRERRALPTRLTDVFKATYPPRRWRQFGFRRRHGRR
jgi:hypothetical protein